MIFLKKKKRIAMIIIWAALTIGFGVFSWHMREDALNPVKVYRIAQEIPLNSKIGVTDFQAVEIPGDAVTSDMVTNPNDIVESNLHASTRLLPGQYAVSGMFVESEDVDPFAVADLTNMRQVTIPVNYVDALGGNIRKGDKIDLVYVGGGRGDEVGDEYTYSRTFAQGVLVYSVTTNNGYRFQDHSDRLEGSPMTFDDEDMEYEDGISAGDIAQVTLAVEPALAEEITTRLATGDVKIVGRFNETEDSDTVGYVIGDFERQFSGQGNPETGN